MTDEVLKRHVTRGGLGRFFDDEIANERNGGVSPATLASAVDSLIQAPDDVLDGWLGRGDTGRRAAVMMMHLMLIAGPDLELRDLRR